MAEGIGERIAAEYIGTLFVRSRRQLAAAITEYFDAEEALIAWIESGIRPPAAPAEVTSE